MKGKLRFIVSVSMVAVFLGTLASFAFTPVKTSAQSNTQNFTISSFDADYYLDRDFEKTSTLNVTETINAVFPDYDQNHGIRRAIPQSYQGHTVSLKVQSVRNPAGILPYTTSEENGNLVLKIGDPNTYVHGKQTYTIQYTMRNAVLFLDDHDEFYWDINGDQWPQSFGSVTARVHISQALAKEMVGDLNCYSVMRNTKSSDTCTISSSPDDNGDTVILTEAHYLQPYTSLTVAMGFKKGTFEQGPEVRREQLQNILVGLAVIAVIVLPPLIAFIVMFRRWRKFGRDPKGRGVIVPEYQPPKGLTPVTSDYLMQEKLRDKALSATVIDLAVRHFISIYEVEGSMFKHKSYELELLQKPVGLTVYEQTILQMFFGDSPTVGSRIKLSDLKNKLSKKLTSLDKDLGKGLFAAGFFASNPQTVRKKYAGIGSTLMVIAFVAIFFFPPLIFLTIGFGICGFILVMFSRIMPARSEKGVHARDALLGLEDYMKLAEADRIRFLQSPEGAEKVAAAHANGEAGPKNDLNTQANRIQLFERLLPYAMLFGIEKDWAKQFADVYTEAPDWYHGNWGTFNAMYLASSLGGFASSNASSFTSPSSSGSSGMGGGGFSGGGGGGGGGGGW